MYKKILITSWILLLLAYKFSFKFKGAISIQTTCKNHVHNSTSKISIPEIKYSGYTNNKGELMISPISASSYTVIIERENIHKYIVSNLVVTAGKITYISIKIN